MVKERALADARRLANVVHARAGIAAVTYRGDGGVEEFGCGGSTMRPYIPTGWYARQGVLW